MHLSLTSEAPFVLGVKGSNAQRQGCLAFAILTNLINAKLS